MIGRRRVRVAYRPARTRYRTRAAASIVKPMLLLAVGGAVALWGAAAVRDAWARAPWARVQRVAVAPFSLQDGTPPEGFDRAVGVNAGDPMLGFSASGTARRLESEFPELATVRVRRSLDGRVKVLYRRRHAAAKVWDSGQWLGMDEDGGLFPLRVFAPEDAPPENVLPEDGPRPLPILSGVPPGPGARPALAFVDVLRRLPQPWARGFYKMKLGPSGDAELYLKDGPLVRWGEVALEEPRILARAERLERVLRDPRLSNGIETVRFVGDHRIAVKPKTGDKKNVKT